MALFPLKNVKTRPFSGKIFFTFSDLADLPEWPEGPLIELINGDMYLVPSPSPSHQDVSRNLLLLLGNFVKNQKLGKIYSAPIDVKLSDEDVVIPDLIFIKNEKLSIIKKKYIEGVPDIVIEILSMNRQRDLKEKFDLYQQYGVKEYWTINPQEKTVWIFKLTKEKFDQGSLFSNSDTFQSSVLTGLTITVKDLF
jgi:Uma2 family endonuclease